MSAVRRALSRPVERSVTVPRRPWLWLALAAIATGVAAVAVDGGYLGYDGAWSLVWGDELRAGRLPSYDDRFAPTPHPLSLLVAAGAGLAGSGTTVLLVVSWLSYAVVVGAAGMLGASLGRGAGVLAALLVSSSPLVLREAAYASLDLPFLACCLMAAVLLARAPPRGLGALALLTAAGLLRPEAWPLALGVAIAAAWRSAIAIVAGRCFCCSRLPPARCCGPLTICLSPARRSGR